MVKGCLAVIIIGFVVIIMLAIGPPKGNQPVGKPAAVDWKPIPNLSGDQLLGLKPFQSAKATTDSAGWKCSYEQDGCTVEIDAAGQPPALVQWVRAVVRHDNGDSPSAVATSVLGDLAAMQYQGADPERARKWIADNIDQDADLVISGVRFELSEADHVRLLMIAPE